VGGEDDVPVTALLRKGYGSTPLHLLAHGALLAASAYAILQLVDARGAGNILLWFVAALVLHDALLLPAYATLDRLAARATRPRGAVNFVRFPVALSALTFLLFFPPILGRNDGSFARVAGVEPEGYLERWLLLTAGLFAVSAVTYVLIVTKRRAGRA
jgi:branched-subunit amino acid ABC-type transport system permease component